MRVPLQNLRDEAITLPAQEFWRATIGFWSSISTKFVRYVPMLTKFATDTKIGRIKSPLLIGGSVMTVQFRSKCLINFLL